MSLRKAPAPPGSVPVDKRCQVGEGGPARCHAVPHSLGDDQAFPSLLGAVSLPLCLSKMGWGRSVDVVGDARRAVLRPVY